MPLSGLPSGPTAEEARRWHLGPAVGACIEAEAASSRDSIVHSLIVRAASHIVRSTLVCQNGFCRPCMQERSRQAGDSVPRRQRTPVQRRPRLPETVRACQDLPAWTGSLWTVWSPASPRFALSCCVTQQRAATLQDVQPEKGPVDLRLGADLSLDSRLARVA